MERIEQVFMKAIPDIKDEYLDRITPVVGDLSLEKFGLDDETWNMLDMKISHIFHVGALVNMSQSYSNLRGPNVIGTENVILLSASSMKHIHFVSTIGVLDVYGCKYKDHDYFWDDSLIPHDMVKTVDTYGAYNISKLIAEYKLVRSMVPYTIYRPGFIGSHSQTGFSNLTDFDNRLVKGIITMGAIPQVSAKYDISPVDYVAKSIINIAYNTEKKSNIFNIVNQDPPNISDIFDAISEKFDITKIPYKEWLEIVHDLDKNNDLFSLKDSFTNKGFPGRSSDYPCSNTYNIVEKPEKLDRSYIMKWLDYMEQL
eukprot:TRINITY_DN7092_c0_g2_i1.p1 TRINITY_DN7092_c0_g2~~TRINITY_DN7092_c0_g2_i1.p1  ORF type:complete len:313 (+),score=67.03 TRINITY_DN7092_c0_g2_i1:116-1054(+)